MVAEKVRFDPSFLSAIFNSDTHSFQPQKSPTHFHARLLYLAPTQKHYQVGDIIDFEDLKMRLRKRGYRPDHFPEFQEALIAIHHDFELHMRYFDVAIHNNLEYGTSSTYTPGNHDIGMGPLDGQTIGSIAVKKEDVFVAKDKKRCLVNHGHAYDPGWMREYSGIYSVGSAVLNQGLRVDNITHALADAARLTRLFPALRDHFTASNFLKVLGKYHIKGFRRRVIDDVVQRGFDGGIVGHIHKWDHRQIKVTPGENETRIYLNCGDDFTKGCALGYTKNGEWIKIRKKDLPLKANEILGSTNPMRQFRPRSLLFLQKCWEACLDYWSQEEIDQKKDSMEPQIAA